MLPQGTELSSDPQQVSFGGSSAIHQSIHLDEESLLVRSGPSGVRVILAEPALLGDVRDLEVEPFAFGRETMKFRDQFLLIHLIQVRHRP
jgi:hypothetical protein